MCSELISSPNIRSFSLPRFKLSLLSNSFRLCLVGCKIFSEKENIFGKGKYVQVFGCILKNVLENIFWCLVVFLKIIEKTHFLLDAHIFSHFLSF